MAWRDGRRDLVRLLIFASAVVTGVAGLSGIHGLRSSFDRALELESRTLLGSDLQVSSRVPFSVAAREVLAGLSAEVATEVAFSTMLHWLEADAGRLVQVRAVDGAYPFYGEMTASPAEAWSERGESPGVFVAASLLEQFGADIGSRVRLGEMELPVSGVIVRPAPRGGRFAGLAPEIYTTPAVVRQSGLLGSTSLAWYHLHLKLSPGTEVRRVMDRIREIDSAGNWRLETPGQRREQISGVLDRFERFLGIIAMAALVLGAIGVAAAIHTQVARRRAVVAVLRCLGVPAASAFGVYLVQAIVLGAGGALLGGFIGAVIHFAVIRLFGGALPVALGDWPGVGVLVTTVLVGFGVCLGFALLPLLGVREIPPAEALGDRDVTGSRPFLKRLRVAWPVYLFLFLLLCGVSWQSSASPLQSVQFTLALVVAFLVLAGTSWLVMRLARRLTRPSWPYPLRQGLANLHRPRNQTLLFLLSLGLGVFLLLSVYLTRDLLLEQIQVADRPDRPNLYLVDVQEDQLDGIRGLLQEQGIPFLENAPMVTMRLERVMGESAAVLRKQGNLPDWVVRREYRSTYRDFLKESEETIAGAWPAPAGPPSAPVPVSLEDDMAGDMGIGLGDTFTMNVQGRPLTARVAHLRRVDWKGFDLNFFVVYPESVLAGAPGFHVVTTRIPDDRTSGELQRQLARQFPNVSAVDLTVLLGTIRRLLAQVGMAVEILAFFTLVSGISILTGTLLHGREQRVRESVLLRTIGASSRQVRRIFFWEYASLGLISAFVGSLLAVGANVLLAAFVFQAETPGYVLPLILATGGASLLSITGGSLISRGVCATPSLRQAAGRG